MGSAYLNARKHPRLCVHNRTHVIGMNVGARASDGYIYPKTMIIAQSIEFDEAVNRLSAILANKEVSELGEQEFRKLLRVKPLFVRSGTSINVKVYRARQPGMDEDLSLIGTFKHPAPNLCNKAGRCHLPHKPVFYGASDPDTAIKEAIQTMESQADGTLIYLSKWQPCYPLNYLDFIYPQAILRSEVAQSLSNHSRLQLHSNLSMYDSDNVLLLPKLAEKIGRAFLSNSHSMSSRICHSILYAQGKELRKELPIHGVLYPSVIKNHAGFNLAIAPFAIRRHFTPVGIWQVRINRNETNGVHLSFLHFGIPDRKGHVSWYKMEPKAHFDWIRSVTIMTSAHMPIEVNMDTTIAMGQEKARISDFIKSRYWDALQQKAYNIGTFTEDPLPGNHIMQEHYIPLEKPVHIKANTGKHKVIGIMVPVTTLIEYSLVERNVLLSA